MPALRLKTKLVFAITTMVVAIVATLAALYVAEVVRQRIQEAADVSHNIGRQLYSVSRGAFTVDLRSYKVDLNDPAKVEQVWEDVLQTDWVVNALLDSVSGDSKLIYDAAIVDTKGVAILHTNSGLPGHVVEAREDFD
jgi:hypothetical protein